LVDEIGIITFTPIDPVDNDFVKSLSDSENTYIHEQYTLRDEVVSKEYIDIMENIIIVSYGPTQFYRGIKSPIRRVKSIHNDSKMTQRRI